MTAPMLYLLAHMREIGEDGWSADVDTDGEISITRGAERVTCIYRFNGGDPRYFVSIAPTRLDGQMPYPFPRPRS